MQSLITSENLTFSKPKCNCGLVSAENKKQLTKHYSRKQNKKYSRRRSKKQNRN
jgi:hypothetical protein